MWTQLPSPKRGQSTPNFRPIFIVAKRLDASRIKIQDATLYAGRPQPRRLCVLWGPSYPQKKRTQPPYPIFGPCLLWPNGWMDEDATWYGSRPWPRQLCIRRVPSYPWKGHSSPVFSAHVRCGHGRPSQLLLSFCNTKDVWIFPKDYWKYR